MRFSNKVRRVSVQARNRMCALLLPVHFPTTFDLARPSTKRRNVIKPKTELPS